ncbi:MAG: DUF4258 domain-containing protein [Gemmatimonadota bacterium]
MSTGRIAFTDHALDRMRERGASQDDVCRAIREGTPEKAREGRVLYRIELDFLAEWAGKFYTKRQVAPVVVEEGEAMVVITVYVFYY